MMTDEWWWRALAAGVGIALAAGPVGVVLVWKRMAYFGDALAHSALLGVTAGYLLGVDINLTTLAICLLFAVVLAGLNDLPILSADAVLGIFSQTALALAVTMVSLSGGVRIDLMSYLFGDLLACTWKEVGMIGTGTILLYLFLYHLWFDLVNVTLHEGLAAVEGARVKRTHYLLYLAVAFVVAAAIKLVGALLITALMVIPAAAARFLARTPLQMMVLASLIGLISTVSGLYGSLYLDLPSGAAIVLVAALQFVIIAVAFRLRLLVHL